MKFKKINYNFSAPQIIDNNLGMQTIQSILKKEFGILTFSSSLFKNPSFIKQYNSWSEDKRNKFIKTIGGVVYFNKVKLYINNLINGEQI